MSVTPGRYRHFKGGDYRVLFVAPWIDFAAPVEGDVVFSTMTGVATYMRSLDDNVMKARWVGACKPSIRESVVVYCNLDGVFARAEHEFEEYLPGSDIGCFVRVGN